MGEKTRQEVLILQAKYKVWVFGCGCADEVQSLVVLLGGQSRMKIVKSGLLKRVKWSKLEELY